MKFNYNGKDYELHYSFRSLMVYENIAKKSFNPKTITDILIFFYSVLCTSQKGETFDFDTFMDTVDSHPEYITQFSEWMQSTFIAHC